MQTQAGVPLTIDLHCLELRFESSRLVEPRAVERLARSIERCGQLIACIVVAEPQGERLVLIDGYRRIAALRRLGRDTVEVERWACDLAPGLIGVLARAQGRSFAAIEEALLIRELVCGMGLSQHEIARQSGRDVSWVSRRLQLLTGLPDTILAAVRAGRLSSWAATRILAPLARANAEHADRLLSVLREEPLSTRELRLWFERYQSADRITREHLIDHPRLFLQAVQERNEQHRIERLREGPEGQCLADAQTIARLIARLRRCLPTLCTQSLTQMRLAIERLQPLFEALQNELTRYAEHDPHRDSQCGAHAPSARPEPARDQPPAQALA